MADLEPDALAPPASGPAQATGASDRAASGRSIPAHLALAGSNRRRFLNRAGMALAAILALGIGLRSGSRRAAAAASTPLRRWAGWQAPELDAGDGWQDWMGPIQNSRGVAAIHDNFGRLQPSSKQPHHWVMVIDLRKCIGCQACVVACKSENNVPLGVFRTWVEVVEVGQMAADPDGPVVTDAGTFRPNVKRFSLPRMCNQCDEPPCVEVCPVQATYKRADGPVLIDYAKCIGCGYCINACPYDARFFNPVQQTADKCTFCVHRIDRGLLPACVTSCVARARVFGDANDHHSEVAQLLAQFPTQQLKSTLGTNPQVFYIDFEGHLQTGADALHTIYPYAAGTNTDEYRRLTGQRLIELPTGEEVKSA